MRMIDQIKKAKKIVLLEPPYKRKYLPLGLAKIATLAKRNGHEVIFQRNYLPQNEDLVCMTSLFTYQSKEVIEEINKVKFLNPNVPIVVGGVYASLMTEHLKKNCNVDVFSGCSRELDSCPPDYTIDWQIEDKWKDFSFVFTTRGCPNRCAYCAVWKLEPKIWINENWKEHIDLSKPYVMISDNNLSAQPVEHIEEICKFLIANKKKVCFDNGFDCKHITPRLAKLMAQLKFVRSGMRLAFDRIEEDGVFQKAVKMLKEAGVKSDALMAYVLFNFTDTPKEAIYRMEECIKLKVRPYPQCYTPLNSISRKIPYIGKYWTDTVRKAFRYFFLMAGFYGKYQFNNWIKLEEEKSGKYKFTQKDWDSLNYEKER